MSQPIRASSGELARRHAREYLRQAILLGELAPGQRLLEPEFAERLTVTRNSVRAALLDLAAQGLVERVLNQGARVKVITVKEAVAITECRMALEGLCAARAATAATAAQIDELDDMNARMAAAVTDGDLVSYTELNRQMHGQWISLAGPHPSGDLLARLNAQLIRHHFQLALRPGRPQQSLREHQAVIDGIRARDPRAAETAARAHIAGVIQSLRDSAQPTAPTPPSSPSEKEIRP
ncbi:GntR family transcriptional regulator [Streptomyces sp. BH-SS-21]|uniref:GntR family transcriptional regulator n=1 Tax=Streptomyces liliiviolaceus TaxID=2823109 RepID=A0A940Y9H7_9ACTN|nr:GntR family transcriptional regulator [Streptomyces liliiviolaceus]MBQ0855547.1 GntR family transcriptional regulator [Streptomyces liliiviolaceus]